MDTLHPAIDTALLIGAAFETGDEAPEPILNPRTGGLILNVPEASQAQIDRAVAAARKAIEGWSRTTPAEMENLLRTLRTLKSSLETDKTSYPECVQPATDRLIAFFDNFFNAVNTTLNNDLALAQQFYAQMDVALAYDYEVADGREARRLVEGR